MSLYDRLYSALYKIRRVEEEIVSIYPTDKIKSPIHLSIGQEAISVGVCQALYDQDVVFGTYRSHALYLAKGGCLKGMMAELYGKFTGTSKGKSGSMHLSDSSKGLICTSAIVGTTIPTAVGYAYAFKYQRHHSIVASFFGEGATEEGVFYESLNFAALKKLPLIFICENNTYAIHTHQNARQAQSNICAKAKSFGIPAVKIDGSDIINIYNKVKEIRLRMKDTGCGPYFIECQTYRWKEHVGPNEDYQLGYRSRDELENWVQKDPLAKIAILLDVKRRNKIEESIEQDIKESISFAEQSDFPPLSELHTDIFQG